MQVAVDTERCIGSGNCIRCAPAVFDQGEDNGLVVLLDPSPPPELHPAVREAALFCPSSAITVSDGLAAPATQ